MERIGVRELRQHASRYLDRVKAGEAFAVTQRGQLVAVLTPPDPSASTREQLISSGQLLSSAGAVHLPRRLRATADSDVVLDELREGG